MKIAILTNTLDSGGAEVVAVNLANAFAQQGYQTDLVVFKGRGPLSQRISKDVKVHFLEVTRTRYIFIKLHRIINQKIKPDIVISNMHNSNMVLATTCFLKKSFKVCFREASIFTWLSEKPKLFRFFYLKLICFFYKKSDIIIANSTETKNDLIRFGIAKRKKIVVIDNPIEFKLSENLKNNFESSQHHTNKFTFVFVGRLVKDKNCDKLIEGFAKVKSVNSDCRLLVLGDGPEASVLKKLAIDLGISSDVKFLGNVDNVADYLYKADLFVLPSRYESFGNVIVEAVVAGLPLLINDCDGGAVPLAKRSDYYKITDVYDCKRFSDDLLDGIDCFRNVKQTEATIQRFRNETDSNTIAALYIKNINSITQKKYKTE